MSKNSNIGRAFSQRQVRKAFFETPNNILNPCSYYSSKEQALQRVMRWFQMKGIISGDPNELQHSVYNSHKQVIAMNGIKNHIQLVESINRRFKRLAHDQDSLTEVTDC